MNSTPLPADYEHRRHVRSLLALIRAIVHRTATSAPSVQDYVSHLAGRLDAIARVQEIIMRDLNSPMDLREILADEFLRQGVHGDAADVPGTPLLVSPTVAGALALALHELTTNAVKFSDLGKSDRQISVKWHSHPRRNGWMVLEWREPALSTASINPAGFGFELIRSTLPYEIGASTRILLSSDGLHCDIEFHPTGERREHAASRSKP